MKQELVLKDKLPDGWKWSPLVNNVNKTSSGIKKFNGVKKYVSTGDLQDQDLSFVDVTFENRPSRANMEGINGDVIFAKMKDTDKVLILDKELTNNLYSTGFYILTPNQQKIISPFLFYYLKSDFFKIQKNNLAKGATQKAINDEDLAKIILLLPPLPVQKQIVAKLDAQMAQIEIMKKEAEKEKGASEEMKKAFLFNLFHFNSDLPNSWKKYSVEQLLEPNNKKAITMGPFGSSLKKDELVNKGIQVLWISNIKENNFNTEGVSFITEEKYKELDGFTIYPEDLIMTTMGTIGLVAIVPKNIPKTIISSHLIRIRFNKKLIYPHLMVYLLGPFSPAYKQIYEKAHGAIMKGLNTTIIKNTEVNLPPFEEQEKILRKIENAFSHFKEIEDNVSKKLSAINELPSSLLNEVFGKYKIPEVK